MVLQAEHRELLNIYYGGEARLKQDRNQKTGQALVAYAKKQLRKIRAELALVEDAPMPDRLRYLDANEGRRKGMVSSVINAGGLEDAGGRFIEVEWGNNFHTARQ